MAVQEKNVIRIRSAMSVSSLCRLLKMSEAFLKQIGDVFRRLDSIIQRLLPIAAE